MIFIDNYADWVKEEYMTYMLNNNGTARPGGGRNPDSEEFKKAKQNGYDLSATYWYIYERDTFPFTIKLPWSDRSDFIWWGIKMNPGNFMPVHRDPHTYDKKYTKVSRYWMAMQDWEHGHIFMYDRQVLTDYKKGDVFLYPNAQELHCACNIGNTARLTFHFSIYEL